jgi:tetraacyldisaccharide 4'-kinase
MQRKKWIHRLEKRWRAHTQGRVQGLVGYLVRLLLRIGSFGYGSVAYLRNALYTMHLLPIHSVNVPVISIGNIVLGGSGKTPVCQWLARQLQEEGHTVAILCRGYGGEVEQERGPTLISAGQGPLFSWQFCGDEPYLLAMTLPGVMVIAGRDRVKGAQLACEQGADLILLDDGLQHRRLKRDVEIIVLDGKAHLEKQHLFPRGLLREPVSALKRADCFVVTHCKQEPAHTLALLKRYSKAPSMAANYVLECEEPLEGRSVALWSAIAKPEHFRRDVEELGATVIAELRLSDHEPIDFEVLRAFATRAKALGAQLLLCTEKDWVKRPLHQRLSLPHHPIILHLEGKTLNKDLAFLASHS